jgi:hypothetical protein
VKIFLSNKALLANYLGKEAQSELDTVEFNEENYRKVKAVLDAKGF